MKHEGKLDSEYIEQIDSEYMSAEESKHWEMEAWEYDGDPDKFDDWRPGY